jgi:hypothetical protein
MTTNEVEQLLGDGVRSLMNEDKDMREHIANDRLLWERYRDDAPCPDDYGSGFGAWLAITACLAGLAAIVGLAVWAAAGWGR